MKANIDRNSWEYYNWLASTLQRIYDDNEADSGGLFQGQNVSELKKYTIFFICVRQALADGSKS